MVPAGVTVITGAVSGIGRACAGRFTGRRILVDLTTDTIVHGPDDVVIAGDISNPETAAAIGSAVAEGGGLTAAVHAAGIGSSTGQSAKVLAVNLAGTALLERSLLAHALPESAFVMIASIAGHMNTIVDRDHLLDDPLAPGAMDLLSAGLSPLHAYGLSKRGIQRLAERRAGAWGAKGARIVSLSPGLVDTAMMPPEGQRDPMVARMLAAAPVPRMAQAEEIAAVALFLCSPEAAYITGCDVRVDGGVTAVMRMAG